MEDLRKELMAPKPKGTHVLAITIFNNVRQLALSIVEGLVHRSALGMA